MGNVDSRTSSWRFDCCVQAATATQTVITEIRCRKRPAYPGQRTRQFSVRRERVAEVRRWLSNYQKLKKAIEAVLRT
jgi:hypothetical protein